MILVVLGTQDKPFDRLLKALDKEIVKGNIKDKVVVQAGNTKYKSKNMEIFDFIPNDRMLDLNKEADLIITHGGVGSIIESIKNGKKIIAVARLKKYGEHVNDHQLQIIESFKKEEYILGLEDFNEISKTIKLAKAFKPKKFISNTRKFVDLIENYIDTLS